MIWPEGTNPGHVDRKQRHTRVALNAHTGCVASAPHQNHQHHIHNSCTSPPRRTSHHIARARTHRRDARTSSLLPLLFSPHGFERAARFFDKFHPPAPDRDRLCNETRTTFRLFSSPLFFPSFLFSSWILDRFNIVRYRARRL